MKEEPFPYQCQVFVCTNKRDEDGRVACASHGRCGDALREALKERIQALGLKGRVRISSSGCMDLCEKGPNVMIVYPSGPPIFLSAVQESDLPSLLKQITRL